MLYDPFGINDISRLKLQDFLVSEGHFWHRELQFVESTSPFSIDCSLTPFEPLTHQKKVRLQTECHQASEVLMVYKIYKLYL